MEKQRKQEEAGCRDAEALEKFSSFARCSGRVFLYANGATNDERHGVKFVMLLLCLRRVLFTYLSWKIFPTRFNAFRNALFCLVVLYANYLYFQLFRIFFVLYCSLFIFHSGATPSRATKMTLLAFGGHWGAFLGHIMELDGLEGSLTPRSQAACGVYPPFLSFFLPLTTNSMAV